MIKRLRFFLASVFSIPSAALLAAACISTWIIVAANFDAAYFVRARVSPLYGFFSLAGMLGFVMPFLVWLVLLATGTLSRNGRLRTAAWVSAAGSFAGYAVSTFVKVFTGRIPPPHTISDNVVALSHGFRFGILKGGVFWGWPSSHTATAFGMAVALAVFCKDKKWVVVIAIIYALYIAIGASMSFHWLSDVVAGLILGCVLGVAVGKAFRA